jgi:hypothetical protein
VPANLPTIETLDADGLEEFLAEQLYLTEPNGHKVDFQNEMPAEVDNLKYFRRQEAR